MAVNNYFSHVSPTYGTVLTAMLGQRGVLNTLGLAKTLPPQAASFPGPSPLLWAARATGLTFLHFRLHPYWGWSGETRGVTYYVTQIFIKK